MLSPEILTITFLYRMHKISRRFFFFLPKISICFSYQNCFSKHKKILLLHKYLQRKKLYDSFLYSYIFTRQLQSKNKFQIITNAMHISTGNIQTRTFPLLLAAYTKFKTVWKTMLNKIKCKSLKCLIP